MRHKPRMYSVRQMKREYEGGKGVRKLNFKFPIQRASGQWNKPQKSLLIHSILQDLIVPEVFIVQRGVSSFMPMTVLDGVQRMTTVYEFIKDQFPLSRNTPDVAISNYEYDENGNEVFDEDGNQKVCTEIIKIGGKYFSKLIEELQEKILDFEFSVRLIIEATEKELEDQMFRLNNGKSQTPIQKAVMALGMELGQAMKDVSVNNFIYNRLLFTETQRKNALDVCITMNAYTVLNGYNYKRLGSTTDMTKIANLIKDEGWREDQLDYCKGCFTMLDEMLPDCEIDEKILSPNNIPIFIMNVDKYIQLLDDGEITKEQYKAFLKYWITEGYYKEDFQKYCGKSINDRSQVEARIDVMEKELLEFIGLYNSIQDDDCIEISNDAVNDYIDTINDITDKETALRVLEVMDNYVPDDNENNLNSYIRYLNMQERNKLDKLIDNSINSLLEINISKMNKCDIPVFINIWKDIGGQNINTSMFNKWVDSFIIQDDKEYRKLINKADNSTTSQAERYSYLYNNVKQFMDNNAGKEANNYVKQNNECNCQL